MTNKEQVYKVRMPDGTIQDVPYWMLNGTESATDCSHKQAREQSIESDDTLRIHRKISNVEPKVSKRKSIPVKQVQTKIEPIVRVQKKPAHWAQHYTFGPAWTRRILMNDINQSHHEGKLRAHAEVLRIKHADMDYEFLVSEMQETLETLRRQV